MMQQHIAFSHRLNALIDEEASTAVESILTGTRHTTTDTSNLVHAVAVENVQIVYIVLSYLPRETSHLPIRNDATHSDHMTPIILAALRDNREILQMLLEYGFVLPPLNSIPANNSTFEFNRYCLDLCKAHCSPAYICQTSADPILKVFKLCDFVSKCAKLDSTFKPDYEEILDQCSELPAQLVERCRSIGEVDIILKRKAGHFADNQHAYTEYPRVMLAIAYQQKKFIGATKCQRVLWEHWTRRYDWNIWNFFNSSVSSPEGRYQGYRFSYILFILLLTVHNVLKSDNDNQRLLEWSVRIGLEIYTVIYVKAILLMELKQIYHQGLVHYFSHRWHTYTMVLLLMYVVIFLYWGISRTTIQPRHRRFWYKYDHRLIAEACYSLMMMLSWWKLLYFLQINKIMAPYVISMGRIAGGNLRFMLIFSVALMSFASSLYSIYQHYKEQVRTYDGVVVGQSQTFTYFLGSVKSLFWSIYRYSPPKHVDVVTTEYYDIDSNNHTVIHVNKHHFTETVGYLLFGVSQVVLQIVMQNMFVAMSAIQYGQVQSDIQTEFRFSRVHIWYKYFIDKEPLFPPLNIIPTPGKIVSALKYIFRKLKEFVGNHKKQTAPIDTEKENMIHQELMANLIHEYFLDRDNGMDEDFTVNYD